MVGLSAGGDQPHKLLDFALVTHDLWVIGHRLEIAPQPELSRPLPLLSPRRPLIIIQCGAHMQQLRSWITAGCEPGYRIFKIPRGIQTIAQPQTPKSKSEDLTPIFGGYARFYLP